MSYIKTKNGIYTYDEVKPYFLDESQNLYINNKQKIAITEKQIIARADNLPELCDEFVIVFEDGHVMTDLDYESFGKEWYKNNHIRMRNAQYYGAIWTDKGLIYVAKMNSEGKLCLI